MYCSQSQCFFPIIMIIIEVILVNLSQILRGAGKEPRGEGPTTVYNLTNISEHTPGPWLMRFLGLAKISMSQIRST